MRKSTLIMLGIMLVACLGMLLLANVYLSPLQEDIEAARELTLWLADRGDIAPGSKVRLRRIPKDAQQPGLGLLLEITPAPEVLGRPRALTGLVRRAADQALGAYPIDGAGSVRWLRATVTLPDGTLRSCELLRSPEHGLGDPVPALPEVWLPPTPPPGPDAPAAPASGTPPAPGTQPGPGSGTQPDQAR